MAILALADGTVFKGVSIGHEGSAVGELVFNTSMTGYQEMLTDPSYAEQIITLTYPHIGNVGCNSDDNESSQVWAKGLVIRENSLCDSNYRSEMSLTDWLIQNKVVAIAECDTRQLTHHLREHGAQSACISSSDDIDAAITAAKQFGGLSGLDLASRVSTEYQTEWNVDRGEWGHNPVAAQFHVVAYDFGVKHNILRLLVERGCRVTLVPATTSAADVLALKPDGVFLSNGPGDPAACHYAVDAIKQLLDESMPLFGICLGFQLLALACGAQSIKMKFGHHGANHPVKSLEDGRVFITSQNHGFAIDEQSLPSELTVTHRSLFDNSLQGIVYNNKIAFGFQGHPEASPGPHEMDELFDRFIDYMAVVTNRRKL